MLSKPGIIELLRSEIGISGVTRFKRSLNGGGVWEAECKEILYLPLVHSLLLLLISRFKESMKVLNSKGQSSRDLRRHSLICYYPFLPFWQYLDRYGIRTLVGYYNIMNASSHDCHLLCGKSERTELPLTRLIRAVRPVGLEINHFLLCFFNYIYVDIFNSPHVPHEDTSIWCKLCRVFKHVVL